jgi:hypothetical protein
MSLDREITSTCHSERSEESPGYVPYTFIVRSTEILHFVQNDKASWSS